MKILKYIFLFLISIGFLNIFFAHREDDLLGIIPDGEYVRELNGVYYGKLKPKDESSDFSKECIDSYNDKTSLEDLSNFFDHCLFVEGANYNRRSNMQYQFILNKEVNITGVNMIFKDEVDELLFDTIISDGKTYLNLNIDSMIERSWYKGEELLKFLQGDKTISISYQDQGEALEYNFDFGIYSPIKLKNKVIGYKVYSILSNGKNTVEYEVLDENLKNELLNNNNQDIRDILLKYDVLFSIENGHWDENDDYIFNYFYDFNISYNKDKNTIIVKEYDNLEKFPFIEPAYFLYGFSYRSQFYDDKVCKDTNRGDTSISRYGLYIYNLRETNIKISKLNVNTGLFEDYRDIGKIYKDDLQNLDFKDYIKNDGIYKLSLINTKDDIFDICSDYGINKNLDKDIIFYIDPINGYKYVEYDLKFSNSYFNNPFELDSNEDVVKNLTLKYYDISGAKTEDKPLYTCSYNKQENDVLSTKCDFLELYKLIFANKEDFNSKPKILLEAEYEDIFGLKITKKYSSNNLGNLSYEYYDSYYFDQDGDYKINSSQDGKSIGNFYKILIKLPFEIDTITKRKLLNQDQEKDLEIVSNGNFNTSNLGLAFVDIDYENYYQSISLYFDNKVDKNSEILFYNQDNEIIYKLDLSSYDKNIFLSKGDEKINGNDYNVYTLRGLDGDLEKLVIKINDKEVLDYGYDIRDPLSGQKIAYSFCKTQEMEEGNTKCGEYKRRLYMGGLYIYIPKDIDFNNIKIYYKTQEMEEGDLFLEYIKPNQDSTKTNNNYFKIQKEDINSLSGLTFAKKLSFETINFIGTGNILLGNYGVDVKSIKVTGKDANNNDILRDDINYENIYICGIEINEVSQIEKWCNKYDPSGNYLSFGETNNIDIYIYVLDNLVSKTIKKLKLDILIKFYADPIIKGD